ncbi:MAG: zf-HC2 domain-containing protein [Pseudomonadales bacterium]
MTHPSELMRTRYADRALPEAQAAALQRHLVDCADCRASVDALIAERVALRRALRLGEATHELPGFVPAPTIGRLVAWLGWGALGLWAVNMAWLSLVSEASLPGWLRWLAPDALTLGIDLAVGLLANLFATGLDPIVEAAQSAGWRIVLTVLSLFGLWLLLRPKLDGAVARVVPLLMSGALVFAAAPSHAVEVRHDETRVTIAAGETVDDTLIVAAQDVVIEGTVTGDLFVMGEQVIVRGRVGGVLVAMAERIDVDGGVAGSVLALGERVTLSGGPLGGNLFGAGRAVTLQSGTSVAGNVLLGASEVRVDGEVGRDLLTLAEQAFVAGSVLGNLDAYAGHVELAPTARVAGDLTARVKQADALQVAEGASVAGETGVSTWPERPSKYLTLDYYLGEVLQFLGAFIAGLALLYLFPALFRVRLMATPQLLTTAAFGSVALIATPVLAAAAMLTLIGVPLGVLALLLWLVSLYVAGIVTANLAGRLLLDGDDRGPALPLLAGLTLLFVLINLPFVGGLIRLVATVVGLGLIVGWLRDLWAERA